MDVIHNNEFIFGCDYKFNDRYDGREAYFKVGQREKTSGGLGVESRTNFIPNVWDSMVDSREQKGAGVGITSSVECINLEMLCQGRNGVAPAGLSARPRATPVH